MIVRRVDPRDMDWEEDSPTYRVYFWTPAGDSYTADEYEIEKADSVEQVLQWITEQRGTGAERQFVLYAVSPNGPGLVRLAGQDPSSQLSGHG